jgi:hypothetical protein
MPFGFKVLPARFLRRVAFGLLYHIWFCRAQAA